MKIKDVQWIGSIGIVLGTDDVTGEKKAYIGIGSGLSEEEDTKDIATRGTKLNIAKTIMFLNQDVS